MQKSGERERERGGGEGGREERERERERERECSAIQPRLTSLCSLQGRILPNSPFTLYRRMQHLPQMAEYFFFGIALPSTGLTLYALKLNSYYEFKS